MHVCVRRIYYDFLCLQFFIIIFWINSDSVVILVFPFYERALYVVHVLICLKWRCTNVHGIYVLMFVLYILLYWEVTNDFASE